MKNKYIEELKKVNRKGIDELLDCMDKGGFFEAPCSTKYHLNRSGGLLEHSMNVLNEARKINEALTADIDDETIIITALLHDLGKMGDHGKANYVEKYLKSGERAAVPYETNKDLTYLPHAIRSVMIAERYINLTEDEETAILWHDGLYGQFKYDIPGKETKLYLILHTADMYASHFIEVEEKEGE